MMNWGRPNSSQTPFCHREVVGESGGFQFISQAELVFRAVLKTEHYCPYPNNSMIGLPVVSGRKMPLLFCGALRGTPRAW